METSPHPANFNPSIVKDFKWLRTVTSEFWTCFWDWVESSFVFHFLNLQGCLFPSPLLLWVFFPPLVSAWIPQSGICAAGAVPRRSKYSVHPCPATFTRNFGCVRLHTHTNLSSRKSLPALQGQQSSEGARMTWQSREEDSKRGDEIPACECLKDPNIQQEGSYLGPWGWFLAQTQTDVHGPWGAAGWNPETFPLSEKGGRFCNSLTLLGMSPADTATSWQKGRGKGGGERKSWMIQDVLLCVRVLSSVCILIWWWELIDWSKGKLMV